MSLDLWIIIIGFIIFAVSVAFMDKLLANKKLLTIPVAAIGIILMILFRGKKPISLPPAFDPKDQNIRKNEIIKEVKVVKEQTNNKIKDLNKVAAVKKPKERINKLAKEMDNL